MWTVWIGGPGDFCSSVKRGQRMLRALQCPGRADRILSMTDSGELVVLGRLDFGCLVVRQRSESWTVGVLFAFSYCSSFSCYAKVPKAE